MTAMPALAAQKQKTDNGYQLIPCKLLMTKRAMRTSSKRPYIRKPLIGVISNRHDIQKTSEDRSKDEKPEIWKISHARTNGRLVACTISPMRCIYDIGTSSSSRVTGGIIYFVGIAENLIVVLELSGKDVVLMTRIN